MPALNVVIGGDGPRFVSNSACRVPVAKKAEIFVQKVQAFDRPFSISFYRDSDDDWVVEAMFPEYRLKNSDGEGDHARIVSVVRKLNAELVIKIVSSIDWELHRMAWGRSATMVALDSDCWAMGGQFSHSGLGSDGLEFMLGATNLENPESSLGILCQMIDDLYRWLSLPSALFEVRSAEERKAWLKKVENLEVVAPFDFALVLSGPDRYDQNPLLLDPDGTIGKLIEQRIEALETARGKIDLLQFIPKGSLIKR